MLQLSTILRKIEKNFGLRLQRNGNQSVQISSCILISKSTPQPQNFFEHCLYLLEEMPNATLPESISVLASCAASPFSCTFEGTVDLNEVYLFVQELLYQHLCFLEKKEELIKTVQSDYGIDALIKQAYKYLENPIFLCDFSFHIMSYYPQATSSNHFILTGSGLPILDRSQIQMDEDKEFIDKIIHYPMPFILQRETLKHRILVSSVRSRTVTLCYLCVLEENRPFREDDIDYIDMLSQIIAIELQKSESTSALRNHRHEDFLVDLLKDVFDSKELIQQRCQSIDVHEKLFKWICVIKLPDQYPKQIRWVCGQLKNIFHEHIIAVYNNAIVILLMSETTVPMSDYEKKLYLNFLTANELQAAISNEYTELIHSKEYYEQARQLMGNLHEWYPQQPIVSAQDCGIKLLLSLCPQLSSLRCYVHPEVKYLLYYDSFHQTNYLETIKAYLSSNRNAVQAAKLLNIHKSTFFYRISKIGELFDFSLEDTSKLFSYEISLEIMEYLNQNAIVSPQ